MTENEVAAESNDKENGETEEDISELENAIIKQVEYYFGEHIIIYIFCLFTTQLPHLK